MPTLHVRSVPEDLYTQLQKLARTKSRSMSAQVVNLLYQALEQEQVRQQQHKLLTIIRRRRFTPPRKAPTVESLLREDRRR